MKARLNTEAWRAGMTSRWLYPSLAIIFVLLSWTSLLDAPAKTQISDSIVEAGVIYGAARGINATVSVAQSTQLSIGVASTTPGQLLDPVNDMVERFSQLMTYAIASLALQKILMVIIESNTFNLLLTFALLAYLAATILRMQETVTAGKLVATLIVIRFSLALIVLANALFSTAFLNQNIDQHTQELRHLESELSALEKKLPNNNQSGKHPEEIQRKIEATQKQVSEYGIWQAQMTSSLEALKSDLSSLEAESGCAWWRLFTCKDTATIAKKKAAITALQQNLEQIGNQADAIKEKHKELIEQRECLKKRTQGESCSVSEWISNKFKVLHFRGSVSKVTASLDEWFMSTIDLLALLILKSILLPLAFWYVLYKAIKRIWREQPGTALVHQMSLENS